MATAKSERLIGVLAFVGDGPRGDDFHELAGRHQAAGEGQEAQDHLGHQGADAECRDLFRMVPDPQIVLGRSHQPGGQTAEGVRKRGSLRNGRQRHHGQRHAEHEAHRNGDDDPGVALNFRQQERAADGRQHGHHARENAPPGRAGVVHPHQREDEQDRGNQVNQFFSGVYVHDLPGSRFLNILSIRSVSRKPLTMLVIEATTATVPRIVVKPVSWLPASTIEPTTAMAEIALVKRHQRRVEQPRHVADHQQPGERGQHQHVQKRQKVGLRQRFRPRPSRIRWLSIVVSL